VDYQAALDELLTQTPAIEPRPYQRRIITRTLHEYFDKGVKSVLIESATGCLVGDTVININSGGKSFKCTLREAYLHFHGGDAAVEIGKCQCGCGENTRVPTKTNRHKNQTAGVPLRFVHGHQSRIQRWENAVQIRAYKGELGIGLQPITNIVKSGVKEIYELVLAKGDTVFVLRGTADHPIMTDTGWVQLGSLHYGTRVMVDRHSPQPAAQQSKPKPRDTHVWNLWNHPYGRKVQTPNKGPGYSIRIPRHVAAWEANQNDLTMEQYTQIMRSGDPTELTLVDPTTHVIHHKDRDHYNDNPANLELLTIEEHNKLHGNEEFYKNFGNAIPDYAIVVGVRNTNQSEMTYDVCCEQPYHSFVANGIVVHNSGKTVMALLTIKLIQILSPKFGLPIPKVGFVAMRSNLLNQAAAENTEKSINAEISFFSMFMTTPPTDLDIIVVDEAQHDAASSMVNFHAINEPILILGLSATPFRTDSVKLCFDIIIRDASIGKLIRDGYLSQYDHYTIEKWDPIQVADHYAREPERWGQSLMFFHTLEQCGRAYQRLLDHKINVDFVTGSSDREAQLTAFEERKTDVIVNCMVLTEGFDCPQLKTVFCRPSCKSVTIQMAGRVFRKHEVGRKQLIQPKRTRWPFIRTANPIGQYLLNDDGETWLSLNVNEKLEEMTFTALRGMIGVKTNMPQFITKNANKKKNGVGWAGTE